MIDLESVHVCTLTRRYDHTHGVCWRACSWHGVIQPAGPTGCRGCGQHLAALCYTRPYCCTCGQRMEPPAHPVNSARIQQKLEEAAESLGLTSLLQEIMREPWEAHPI